MDMLVCKVGHNDMPGWAVKSDYNTKVYKLWCSMLHRAYEVYEGCSVCEEWLYLSKFAESIKTLPNYSSWRDNTVGHAWALNKEHSTPGNKVYCPEECGFDTIGDNNREKNSRQDCYKNFGDSSNWRPRDPESYNGGSKNFGSNNWSYNKKHKHVIATFVDGTVTEFSSLQEAGAFFNRTDKLIGMWIRGKASLPENVQSICYGGRD